MGSVLVNPSGSRSPMLRRDPNDPCTPGRPLKTTAKDKLTSASTSSSTASSSSVPLNSEMLRELKRRVLVCLDNNAAAAEVARRLLSERSDFSKAATAALGRRSCPVSSSEGPPRRKSASDASPLEIVSECFEMLDRLLSDIAKKDTEISRLQGELAGAERRCRAFEARLSHLQQNCSRLNGAALCNASVPGHSPARRQSDTVEGPTSSTAVAAADCATDVFSDAPTIGRRDDVTRSPRKSRRSSVEMLSLPSIHDNAANAAATAAAAAPVSQTISCRKRSVLEAVADSGASAKRIRLESSSSTRCKEEVKDEEETREEDLELVKDEYEEGEEDEIEDQKLKGRTDHERMRGRKAKKKRGRSSAAATTTAPAPFQPEEALVQRFGSCQTTGLPYYFGDFDTMLEKKEREAQRRLALIHTPGWRLAPTCGRTRAATLAAAAGNGEAATSLVEADMPEEGSGFEEWAALSDEPFEARHRRLEQAEKKRDRAELRALRERQRNARLRQRQQYLQQAGCGDVGIEAGVFSGKAVVVGAGGGETGVGGEAEAPISVGPVRKGLPESLLPGGLEDGGAKECCIYYYPKDKVPVVAFGRLLTARRKKSHGFSLPWMAKRSR